MERVHLGDNKKILFLGYGAVAKVSWNYFDRYVSFVPSLTHSLTLTHGRYFVYNAENVYAVDQFATSFNGPNVDKLHKFVRHISRHTFDQFLDEIGFGILSHSPIL